MKLVSMKVLLLLSAVIVIMTLFSDSVVSASTPTPEAAPATQEVLPEFVQRPTVDLRTTILTITRNTDAAMELTIINPTLNDDVNVVGEVQFRVPPGMTIYGSLLGASGGSGLKVAPFVNDPIKPGGSKTWSFYARSQQVGEHEIKAKVTMWPEGNMKGYHEENPTWPIKVSEASGNSGLPKEMKSDPAPTAAPAPTVAPAPAAPAAQQTTQRVSNSSSGGCNVGGRPDAGMLLLGLIVPAVGYMGRKKIF